LFRGPLARSWLLQLIVAGSFLPARTDGYAPIRDYAAIGDGRTVGLVASDGSIDWLALPNLDSSTIFGALLDARRGGAFRCAPPGRYRVSRQYIPATNVLETRFETADGVATVTDALTLPTVQPAPFRELARRVTGVSGRVGFSWSVTPRFGYGQSVTRFGWRGRFPVATSGSDAIGLCAWGAGQPRFENGAISGEFELHAGESACLALVASHQEPLVFPPRAHVEQRLRDSIAFWQAWAAQRRFGGGWRDAVLRSALALKLLIFAPSGAIAAAPTSSLPEEIGGVRNWDYRFCWIRDSSFILDALLGLQSFEEAHAFFWWFMHATWLTHPRLRVLYRLDGGAHTPERTVPLEGYRRSTPVRVGNAAAGQTQLDVYGDLFETAWLYASAGQPIDRDTGKALAEVADLVADIWRQPDSGIWEVRSAPRHFTHSKVMCWVALDRAAALARQGALPSAHQEHWAREASAVADFVDEHCWSAQLQSYVRAADLEDLDASLLLLPIMRFGDPHGGRVRGTIDAIRSRLGHGDIVDRYHGEDGVAGGEGAFLACSFWLVQSLVLTGRREEAASLMDRLVGRANDVGLYSEEIDPSNGAFLGNFPQGLVHLALINAALAFEETAGDAGASPHTRGRGGDR
jgi:GH15 family glucan-1,4-alpha-glucosidase